MTWACGSCGGALRSWYDQCWCGGDAADPSTVRSQPVENDAPPQRMSWHEAMAELRARYAPPA